MFRVIDPVIAVKNIIDMPAGNAMPESRTLTMARPCK
jgi:hypothetical protein